MAKKNYLLERIREIFSNSEKGKVLDLGCGDGDYSHMLKSLGFEVIAVDLDEQRFKYRNEIEFKRCDFNKNLMFANGSFNYILLLEVIEHLKNPYAFMQELRRILKDNGILIFSTPNILSLKSRMRFLFEGAFEYFREPPLDQIYNPKEKIFNLHLHSYRFQELEYLLWENGFTVDSIFTSVYEHLGLSFLMPLIKLQLFLKQRRSKKRGGIDYSRINNILLTKELLYGRHLIIKAIKRLDEKNFDNQSFWRR